MEANQVSHEEHLVQRFQGQGQRVGLLGGALAGVTMGAIGYPFVRLQTLVQTQHTTGNFTGAFTNLKNNGGFYRGLSPFLFLSALSGAFLSVPFVGPALAGAFYPLEVAQIKLAADKSNATFNLAETVKSMTNPNSYAGVSAFIARNYLITLGMAGAATSSFIFAPCVLAAIALDNVRRNFVVQKFVEGNNTNMSEVYRGIMKNQGYSGLFRGAAFYPALYAIPLIAMSNAKSAFAAKH